MGDSGSSKFGDSSVIELTGKIMVVAIIILFFVVVFVFCLHMYAKWFWYRRQENNNSGAAGRRRHQEMAAAAALRRGLDVAVLNAIPITLFDTKEFKDGLECSVCLSEVNEGEKTRFLPKCNHGFHVECIDMWFQSHSTCPLCRNPVSNPNANQPSMDSVSGPAVDEANGLPTNVLFWGDETRVSTSPPCAEEGHRGCSSASTSNMADGMLVIDIPRAMDEEEDQKSPIPTRLRSLKRLLSGNRRIINLSSTNRHSDLEL